MNYLSNLSDEFREYNATFTFDTSNMAEEMVWELLGLDRYDIWFLKKFKRISIITKIKNEFRCFVNDYKIKKNWRKSYRRKWDKNATRKSEE